MCIEKTQHAQILFARPSGAANNKPVNALVYKAIYNDASCKSKNIFLKLPLLAAGLETSSEFYKAANTHAKPVVDAPHKPAQ
ncbi:hypothetical protein ACFSJU_03980 [Paradesertivirga mongoliensis]|uniref:Uncharacterized protein n=1 Tax=Paradesertivirga mongoliensis TaxID=2100740 RepID=A0ABW4ZI76_9SPHI|nr:hypothetical protein [Pedobacter mongoliensis]